MEESIKLGLDYYIQETFDLKQIDVQSYSPLVFAYIGDCVYDLIIKSMVVQQGNRQVQKLHQDTSKLVQASAQSAIMRFIQAHLTEEEHVIYRRGRNAKSVTPAKNQSITDYRRATGFEALLGFLYLKKEYARIMELVKMGLEKYNDGKS
ncbi:MAG: ribonuclease III [Lachnospiraceae bacterium]|nr:ribonuclease III [Lachnospiraceae bacterium]